jgi:hypothetical protein
MVTYQQLGLARKSSSTWKYLGNFSISEEQRTEIHLSKRTELYWSELVNLRVFTLSWKRRNSFFTTVPFPISQKEWEYVAVALKYALHIY